jgi:hypothetical protein
MYEWMANERIATYRREASLERLGLEAAAPRSDEKPAAGAMFLGSRDTGSGRPVMRSGRRALAAAFVGLVAMGALRRKG